ncbi:MAG: glycosyltransferase, partial [Pseudomonadota bacterium]
VIEDGRTGLLTPPGDAGAMARAILRVLDEPASAAMGAGADARARQRFSLDAISARHVELYDEILRAARGGERDSPPLALNGGQAAPRSG